MRSSYDGPRDRLAGQPATRDLPRGVRQPARSLWLVCSDAIMDRAVDQIREIETAVVLRLAGGGWQANGALSDEALADVEKIIGRWNVRDLAVCGHSYCSAAPSKQQMPSEAPLSDGSDAFMDRIRRSAVQNRIYRERTLRQLAVLAQIPFIAHRLEQDALELHGMFYLAECDSFLRYDTSQGKFIALEAG